MITGRLEVYSVLVLLTPTFWRRQAMLHILLAFYRASHHGPASYRLSFFGAGRS